MITPFKVCVLVGRFVYIGIVYWLVGLFKDIATSNKILILGFHHYSQGRIKMSIEYLSRV